MAERKITRPRQEAVDSYDFREHRNFRRMTEAIRDELHTEEYDFEMMYWPFEIEGSGKLLENGRVRQAAHTVNEYMKEEFDG